jgi:major intracellular serine protease
MRSTRYKQCYPNNICIPDHRVHGVINTLSVNDKTLLTTGIMSSAFQRSWDQGFTGKDIVVAIIDSGIDGTHPDLIDKVVESHNFTGEPISEIHGTHVAGCIAGNGQMKGGARDCKLLDLKVTGRDGGNVPNVIKAILYAINSKYNVRVINMSVGGTDLSQEEINGLKGAINMAWQRGIVCVAASGNDGRSQIKPVYEYPASIDRVQAIAACSVAENLNNITLAPFSTINDKIALSANGVNVFSTAPDNKYAILSGTSMASPFVTAMCACIAQEILQQSPQLSGNAFAQAVVQKLYDHVMPLPKYNLNQVGRGFLRTDPQEKVQVIGNKTYYNQSTAKINTLSNVSTNVFIGYTI